VVTGEGVDTVRDTVEAFRFADRTLTRAQLLAELTPAVATGDADTVVLSRSGGTFNALGGDDTIGYQGGFVTVDGGAGRDTLDFSAFGAAVWVSLAYNGAEGWTMDRPNLAGGTWRAIAEVANAENVVGTAFNDFLRGNGSDNTIFYTGGLDTVDGMGGSDTIDFSRFGSAVWVDLASNGREAWTRGNAGLTSGTWREIADLAAIENLTGTAHADLLRGNGGVNRLEGGAGNDTLTGRGGNDVFVFRAGMGQDTITDFAGNGAATGDAIALALGAAFDSFAEVMAAGSQAGSSVVFDFGGGNTLTLQNTTLASLHQNDFLFA
jgi:Ca2+-binding RTX toxin-like protein